MATLFSKAKSYIMSESEAKRLQERHSHMDVLKQCQVAKKNFGDKKHKLKQRMYLHSVGKIPDFEQLSCATQYNSEIVENYLETACLYQNAIQLLEQREEFAVIEDDFGPALEQMMKDGISPSFRNLMIACAKYDSEPYIAIHREKSNVTYKYFTGRGVSEDDARAYGFAIAFYTGGYSAALNADATTIARRLVKQDQLYVDQAQVDARAAMILYYLVKGLSHIDFYWGEVVRYINLENEDLQDYRPGELITWLQFSSSDKGGQNMAHFTDRNTTFIIYSLTGRSIQYFSNCADEEDEVLFLPHSTFLVCDVIRDRNTRRNQIYLRQVSHPFEQLVS